MTLNGVVALFCIISRNSIALQADYVTVVEDKTILSAKYRIPVIFGQRLADQRSSRTVSLWQLIFLLSLMVDYIL